MKKILVPLITLGLSCSTNAYNHFPLTPSWFGNLYEAMSENKDNVWRGTVTSIAGPTTIIVKNINNEEKTVNLLHLTTKKNATKTEILISNSALEQLQGKQIYILGNQNKNNLHAKILDASGGDINLGFIAVGAFDINTTSLLMKSEKQQYVNAYNNAKKSRSGIWKHQPN